MTVYALAQLRVHDHMLYARYMARFRPVLDKYNGKLLAADDEPSVLEGEWDREKVVLLEFADAAAFGAWATSPEYTEIAKDRKAGADAVVLLIKSFAHA